MELNKICTPPLYPKEKYDLHLVKNTKAPSILENIQRLINQIITPQHGQNTNCPPESSDLQTNLCAPEDVRSELSNFFSSTSSSEGREKAATLLPAAQPFITQEPCIEWVSSVIKAYGTSGQETLYKAIAALADFRLTLLYNPSSQEFSVSNSHSMQRSQIQEMLPNDKYFGWRPEVQDQRDATGNWIVRLVPIHQALSPFIFPKTPPTAAAAAAVVDAPETPNEKTVARSNLPEDSSTRNSEPPLKIVYRERVPLPGPSTLHLVFRLKR